MVWNQTHSISKVCLYFKQPGENPQLQKHQNVEDLSHPFFPQDEIADRPSDPLTDRAPGHPRAVWKEVAGRGQTSCPSFKNPQIFDSYAGDPTLIQRFFKMPQAE